MKRFLKVLIFFFISIFFLEYVYKVSVFNIYLSTSLLYIGGFSLFYALILTLINGLLPKKISYPITLTLLILITVIFIGEANFYHIQDTTLSIYSFNLASQALDFKEIFFKSLKEHYISLILFLVPLITYILMHKKIEYHITLKESITYVVSIILIYILLILSLLINKDNTYSAYNLYFKTHAPTITVNKFGLLTEFRLDVKRFIFGFKNNLIVPYDEADEEEETTEYNILDLTFEETDDEDINALNSYFESISATNKNEYTGIFEGKNIIYILAEGFNSIAVDEDLTPTLYKLVNNSFVFTNYYTPVFMSTTGGEFQYMTSLIPTQKSLTTWKEGNVTFPYAIGNVFGSLNYYTYAFHDWTYSYYKRNKTMPTLGFTSYLGCKNGLEEIMNCNMWPTSDIQMIEATYDYYSEETPFAIYYITVSGHAEYNFYGNNIAMKNKSLVEDLDYSTSVKAYLATQIELDKALELLLTNLEEDGILNDTVIVLSGDHYPYTLSVDEINEISTEERDETFEVNKSNLIIYNTEIETTVIDKLATSIDVLPTILNMFGIEYDSRLLLGKDIMSEHDSLVIFADYSWITELGRYNAKTEEFTPNEDAEIPDDYVETINKKVQNYVSVSDLIIDTNYYSLILQ